MDTICALATPNGRGAVSIVRLSGPQSCAILNRLVRTPRALQARVQTFCTLYDGDEILDKALVTYFQAPASFTGEDVVEFAVHASPYITGRLLELLCNYGAVLAKRGEFSERAFFNGKMDLIEAQGLCDLIAAGNKAAHRLAMTSLDGKLSARLESLKKKISELLAQIEVRLDDVDEEMTPLSNDFIHSEITTLVTDIKTLADTFSVGKFIKDGIKTAIVGVPNSGKSSLLNALVGFDRVIVSDQSGTTRDTIEEVLEINGQKIILTDTAGIRDHALDPAEQEGMKRSKRAMEQADVILFVLDASRDVTNEEKSLWREIQQAGKKVLLVRNKSDKGNILCTLENISLFTQLTVSCKTGAGIEDLKKELTDTVTHAAGSDGLMISNLRHYQSLVRAQTELETALLQQDNTGGEIYAEYLRRALTYLQDLIGEVTPDDVLGIIFSQFCMGK